MRILVVDDEKDITEWLQEALSQAGYAVDSANTSEEGEYLAESIPYDLVILDVNLPGKDGIKICRSLREKDIKTRIMMLTGAKKDDISMVQGLDNGADDYLLKPVHYNVLMARVRTLLRREPEIVHPVI